MQSGKKRQPLITTDAVDAALKQMVQSKRDIDGVQPLLSLYLVDEVLFSPSRPNAGGLRELALTSMLRDLIAERMIILRNTFDLSSLKQHSTRQEAIHYIQEAAATEAPAIIGWTYLYCLYAQDDLAFSHDEFSQWSNFNPRSVRRFRKEAIEQLTHLLIEREWAARERHQRQQLFVQLGGRRSLRLHNRLPQIETLLLLLEERHPTTIYISGSEGCGKTALARYCLEKIIQRNDSVAHIAWHYRPKQISHVIQELEEALLPPDAGYTLNEALQILPTIVVLDGLEKHGAENFDWHNWQVLHHTTVIITSRQYVALHDNMQHLHLAEFNQDETVHFVQETYHQQRLGAISSDDARWFWNTIGGNPRALQLAIGYAAHNNAFDARNKALDTLYAQVYATLNARERQLLWIMCLAFPNQVSLSIFEDFFDWTQSVLEQIVSRLQALFWIECSSSADNTLTIAQSLNNYLRRRLISDTTMIVRQEQFLASLKADSSQAISSSDIQLVEWLLQSDWTDMTQQDKQALTNLYYQAALEMDRHRTWYNLWMSDPQLLNEDDAAMCLAFVRCARRVGDHQAASEMLSNVILQTGANGNFDLQAQGRLELAISARLRGKYRQAQSTIEQVERFAQRTDSIVLKQSVFLEKAQLAVDLGDRQQLQAILNYIDVENNTLLLMQAESALLQGNLVACRRYAKQVIELHDDTAGIAHTIMGRCHQLMGNQTKAVNWFSAALGRVEQSSDLLSIGRCQTNLAAALIACEQYKEARDLLQAARRLQRQIDDRIGLQATQHNLFILQQSC